MHDDDDDDVIVCKYEVWYYDVEFIFYVWIMIYDDDINNGLTLVWIYYLLLHYSMISTLVIPYK